MRRSKIVIVAKLSVTTIWCLLISLLVVSSTSAVSDTEINARLCSGTSSVASLNIQQPTGGAIFSELPLSVSGQLNQLVQIQVMIDGQYNLTVPIAANQTTFQFSVSMGVGTHTLRLDGVDACHVSDPTQSLVVTYEPAATSSVPTTPAPGSSPQTTIEGSLKLPFQDVPLIGAIVRQLYNLSLQLDFDTREKNDWLISLGRLVLFCFGLLMLFGASWLERFWWICIHRREKKYVDDPDRQKNHQRTVRHLRLGGGVLLIIIILV